MKKVFLFVCILLSTCSMSYATNYVKETSEELESIGQPYSTQKWANYKAKDAYDGIVDRSVLQGDVWKSDPTILYSVPVKKTTTTEQIIYKTVYVEEPSTEVSTVSEGTILDENGNNFGRLICVNTNSSVTCDWN